MVVSACAHDRLLVRRHTSVYKIAQKEINEAVSLDVTKEFRFEYCVGGSGIVCTSERGNWGLVRPASV